MKYPEKLAPGATIGLVCTSSAISREREAQCTEAIRQLGYKVKTADNLSQNLAGYMAGDGETRATWINCMFADPEVDAIFCIRGGDGGSRTIEYLDLKTIKANPKIFVGYSDVTSFHLIFNQICGFVTFHGPMVSSNMVDSFDDESRASLFQALNADAPYEFKNPDGYDLKVLQEGEGEGTLVGGNFALLGASMGTPYEVNTKGKILFIEEIGETMSRIDRLVYQLKNSCKLKECAGILLGQFTRCPNKDMPEYTELNIFKDALADLNIPVMYNIQAGHGQPNMTLPLGAHCIISTKTKTICFDQIKR
ncbi:S66 peptidase family protein [Aminipila terrae]|uniref:LD-carboxypeptidase n=1 Tax=Aminipila terrae TaxID=2697030 RepID=A0A6P1MC75_9FIRM|nr:LD-carboxypeptidase [Aminipila terrae]QHI71507.1 LD-carboxypeptidase [Aminipila terrae]